MPSSVVLKEEVIKVFLCFNCCLMEITALAFGAFSWTQIREIPNSNLMVSLNHVEGDSTSLQLYNISQKGNVSVVYAFEEAIGNRNLPVSGGKF